LRTLCLTNDGTRILNGDHAERAGSPRRARELLLWYGSLVLLNSIAPDFPAPHSLIPSFPHSLIPAHA